MFLLGKPVTTSVPSIRFNANAEEIEELYGDAVSDDEEQQQQPIVETPESNSSPLKSYLPKLIKRSASIDTSPASGATTTNQESSSSPPSSSDPWRFFTDIKVNFIQHQKGKQCKQTLF